MKDVNKGLGIEDEVFEEPEPSPAKNNEKPNKQVTEPTKPKKYKKEKYPGKNKPKAEEEKFEKPFNIEEKLDEDGVKKFMQK